MEHAEVQAGWIATMLKRSGLWSDVTTHFDLNGKERATSAVLADQTIRNERMGQ
jgi:release factor glutamine methyltransferase